MNNGAHSHNPDKSEFGCAPSREPVLILVHADGFIECFANKHIDVIVRDVPLTSTAAGEIAAEAYIDSTLPIRYRDLYWPDLRRAMHTSRVVTPESIAATQLRLDILAAIREMVPAGDTMGAA